MKQPELRRTILLHLVRWFQFIRKRPAKTNFSEMAVFSVFSQSSIVQIQIHRCFSTVFVSTKLNVKMLPKRFQHKRWTDNLSPMSSVNNSEMCCENKFLASDYPQFILRGGFLTEIGIG